jgi:8-oxo-dGTP pyrophosphatase MutT (NUDIX family)
MLLFYAAPDALDLDAAHEQGLSLDSGRDLRLHPSLDAAQRNATGPILVVDSTVLSTSPADAAATAGAVRVARVPAAALQNVAPYRPPQTVTAGGGYVARPLPNDIALLLIYRRGVWDLPKGHQDPGEDIETCALREVREEVGIDDLRLLRPLGTTQHGYPHGDTYAVKTTYWYLLRTPERSFSPEQKEGIRRVAWARWPVARRHIGYDNLRRHMDRIEEDVRAALA